MASSSFAEIECISFDAAGTLIAPTPSVGEIYAEVLATEQILVAPDSIEKAFRHAFKRVRAGQARLLDKTTWRLIVEDTLAACTKTPLSDSLFEELWDTFAQGRRWKVLADVRETLSYLQSKNYRLIVLSNNDPRLHSVLRDLQLTAHFEHIFTSVEIGYEKPNACLFQTIAQTLQLPPEKILHIGDSRTEDFEGATQANWQALLLGESLSNLAELRSLL